MKVHPEKIWSGFRAEESTPAEVALHGWRYLLKYLFKKRKYTAEEREWASKCASVLKRVKEETIVTPLLKIGLAGDLMWLSNEEKAEISPTLTDRMKSADFWIGNLESLVTRRHLAKIDNH